MNRTPTTAALAGAAIGAMELRSVVLDDVASVVGLPDALAVLDEEMMTEVEQAVVLLGVKELVDLDVWSEELGRDMTCRSQSVHVFGIAPI